MGNTLQTTIKGGCLAAAALFSSHAMAGDEVPRTLAPISAWNVSYDEDSCRLLRLFGSDADQTVFYIERYEPGDNFFLVIAGAGIDKRTKAKNEIRFGPNGRVIAEGITQGSFGKEVSAIMNQTGGLYQPDESVSAPKSASSKFDREAIASDVDVFGQTITAEQEKAISWVEVKSGKNQPFRLELGPMDKPMEAMRACTDDLVSSWGLDIASLKGMTRAPVPAKSPATWLTTKDYPESALKAGEQGIVQVRLAVGADGSAQSCHIQRSTRPVEFDQAVCRALMKRAQFEPALGADGKPMPSYWRSAVRFIMPG